MDSVQVYCQCNECLKVELSSEFKRDSVLYVIDQYGQNTRQKLEKYDQLVQITCCRADETGVVQHISSQ